MLFSVPFKEFSMSRVLYPMLRYTGIIFIDLPINQQPCCVCQQYFLYQLILLSSGFHMMHSYEKCRPAQKLTREDPDSGSMNL